MWFRKNRKPNWSVKKSKKTARQRTRSSHKADGRGRECHHSCKWHVTTVWSGERPRETERDRERETDRLASGNYTNLCQLSQQKHPMVKGVWQEQVTEGFCLEGVQEPPLQSLSTTEFWVVRNTPASWPVPLCHHIQEGLAVAVRKHNNPNKADLTGRACQLHGQRKMMVDQSPVTLAGWWLSAGQLWRHELLDRETRESGEMLQHWKKLHCNTTMCFCF